MSSTTIPYNPKTAALLVIDMQVSHNKQVFKKYSHFSKTKVKQECFRSDANDIITNVQFIVKTCHEKNIPIFWTQHGHRNLELDGGALGRWVSGYTFLHFYMQHIYNKNLYSLSGEISWSNGDLKNGKF